MQNFTALSSVHFPFFFLWKNDGRNVKKKCKKLSYDLRMEIEIQYFAFLLDMPERQKNV